MGRKAKKRSNPSTRTPPRTTPARTPTNLSAYEEPEPPSPTQVENTQQLSPPLSPDIAIDTSQTPLPLPPVHEETADPAPTVQTARPPTSPQSAAPSPTVRRGESDAMEPTRSIAEKVSRGAYGANPHVIACVSCNDICVLTGPRGVIDRAKVCPGPSSDGRFFPVVCSACEDWRGSLWLRLEGGRKPPHRDQQRPGTISTSMLSSWPLYAVIREKFGAEFFTAPNESSLVVSRAHDWWKEGILMHDKTIFLRWRFDENTNDLYEIQPRPRKDEFFGQPW